MNTNQLSEIYPYLYHMADKDSLLSIEEHGLLSTKALLDLFEIHGEERNRIEVKKRPESIPISHPKYGKAVIRDQKPIYESSLNKCLTGGLNPGDWFILLNSMTFFWPTKERLSSFLNAQPYRNNRQLVLVINTSKLINKHNTRVYLSVINSGSTLYAAQPRGRETFQLIEEFDFNASKKKRGWKKAIAEVAVDYSVPDIAEMIICTREMMGNENVNLLP